MIQKFSGILTKHIKSPLQCTAVEVLMIFVPSKVKIHNLSEQEKPQQFLEKKTQKK